MGSKAFMLNGMLGAHLLSLASTADRFVDLFSGSGAVVSYVAENASVPTVSVDQMLFPSVLASSITGRTRPLDGATLARNWLLPLVREASSVPRSELPADFGRDWVMNVREQAAMVGKEWFVSRDYGGHYFSPGQAHWLDRAVQTLPSKLGDRAVALGALVRVASDIAASPGHTAQPFQPSEQLLPHIQKAWSLDVLKRLDAEVVNLASRFALKKGISLVGDAETFVARSLHDGDVVFLDPPYSEAQYGRFYHVLEGIARGGWGSISGAGRAPAPEMRVSSDFSRKTKAQDAMTSLLVGISRKRVCAVLTYPEGQRSNNLSWEFIAQEAYRLKFHVEIAHVSMQHSTLGGSNSSTAKRKARHALREVVLTLRSPCS